MDTSTKIEIDLHAETEMRMRIEINLIPVPTSPIEEIFLSPSPIGGKNLTPILVLVY